MANGNDSIADLCGSFVSDAGKSSDKGDADIIEFCESPWGLGLGASRTVPPLFATQRFVLKCYYGLELDDSEKRDIVIRDKFNEETLFWFNEQEFFDYLYSDDRINEKVLDGTHPNMILVVGRRGSKTSVVSFILAYEFYKLLNKYSPHEFYRMMPDDEIRITSISVNEERATEIFDRTVGHIERSEFFDKYRFKPTARELKFQTQRDIDKYGNKVRHSVLLKASPCSARGLRGPNNIVVVLDEMAFFFKDGGKKSDKDDRAVYNAVSPSVAAFNGPDGEPHGRIIGISSPSDRSGKFYDEYERSHDDITDDLLCIQMPSWEMNPTISSKYLKGKYYSDPITYMSEFGAQFSDRLKGWITDKEILYQNIVGGLKYKERSLARIPYFMGVDIGLKNDGTSVVIGHITSEMVEGKEEARVEVDWAEVRYAKDEGKEHFQPDDIAEWIASFTKRFHIVKGLMDQYYGMSIMGYLERNGYKQFEMRHFDDSKNSALYQNLMSQIIQGKLRIPEGEPRVVDGKTETESELVKELLKLQSEQKSKYMVKVFVPEGRGHDDLSDGFARMVMLTTEYAAKGYGTKGFPGSRTSRSVKSMAVGTGVNVNRGTSRLGGRALNRGRGGMFPAFNTNLGGR